MTSCSFFRVPPQLAELAGPLDPQLVAVQSAGMSTGSPLSVAGMLRGMFQIMKSKLAIASTVLLTLLILLFLVSFHFELTSLDDNSGTLTSPSSIGVTSSIRCCFSSGSVWFFSHECPYRGSLRHLSDGHGGIVYDGGHARVNYDWDWSIGEYALTQMTYIGDQNKVVGQDRCADLPGIYYRHFMGLDESIPTLTLKMSLCYPIFLCAVLPSLWLLRRLRLRGDTTVDRSLTDQKSAAHQGSHAGN